MNKVSIVSLVILSSISLSACGNSGSINSVPVRMTSLSLDSSACEVRPETKVQGYIEPGTVSDFNKVVTTPVLTPVQSNPNLNIKTEAKVETKTDSVDLGDDLPEVKAPPATDTKTPSQPEEKQKTKVGQLIDKVKNIFKKKS